MAEKIVLAELNIDVDALLKSTSLLKKEIDNLKLSQKELTKAGNTSSEAFVQQSSDLKVLTTAYNQNIKAISAQTQATADLAVREELLNLTLQQEATSIAEAREQNKLLNKLRNETNVSTQEGIDQLNQLNSKLDSNNEFIKENADQYLKQKINVGNYKDSIKEAFQELNIFNGGLGGFIERSKEAGGAGNLLKTSLAGATQGFLGIAKASLAFIATPIGAVLALLVGAFALVQSALSRSEEATNKLKGAFSIFSGIINTVLKALEPLGEFLIDGIVMGLELAGKAVQGYVDIVSSALDFLGFEDASKAVKNFNTEITNGIKSAKDLADAEAELEKAQRKARLTQLEYQKDAEKLRQIRDDETKSTAERIKANEDLGRVLKEQQQAELAIAQIALKVANLRIANEGKTKEALDAQLDALTQIADIEERITGQQSEQLVNRNSLIKEANDKAKEIAQQRIDNALKESKSLIDLFIAEQGFKAKSLEDAFDFEQQLTAKKLQLLKDELKAKKLTQTEYDAQRITTEQEFLKKQAELTVEFARRELEAELERSKSIIDVNKFLTEQILIEEKARINAIAEQKRQFEATRLAEGIISETQYNDAINAINKENQVKLDEADLARKQAKEEQAKIDLENTRAVEDLLFQENLDIQLQRLEQQRLLEVANAEKTGADVNKINQKYYLLDAKLKQQAEIAKIDSTKNALNEIGSLLGAFGVKNKNLSIALATADAFLGATKAYASQLVVGDPTSIVRATLAGGKALLFGLANVAQIAKTDTKFEQGGIMEVGGNRHSSGGTKFVGSDGTRFEAERGELIGVLNRNASAQFMDFNNAFGQRGGVGISYAESGGIIARNMDGQSGQLEQFAELTAQLVQSMPSPIVTVEDINAGTSRVNVIESGATFG